MYLSPAQLERFVAGCDSTQVTGDGLRVHRLPAALCPAYDDPSRFAVRRDCSSGARFRFLSDSTNIDLAILYGEPAEAFFQGAAVVDSGTPIPFGPLTQVPEWRGSVFSQRSRTTRLVDLWLPHLANVRVSGIWLDDGCTIEPAPSLPVRWLAYGDSITQGFCATVPTSTCIARCALALDAEVCNLAVGGSTLMPQLADALPSGEVDLCTIAFGACDFQESVSLDALLLNARRLIDAIHTTWRDARIVLITPLLWPATPASPVANALNLSPQDYRDALRSLQLDRPFIHVAPGESLIDPDPELFFDWIHPNDQGFAQYAKNLLPHLQRALAARTRSLTCMESRCV